MEETGTPPIGDPNYDVAVVGLGPIGVTLSILLGRQGLSVLAIDASPDIYELPRAIGLDHEVMRVFQQIGTADELTPFVADYRSSEYRTADGDVIRRFLSQEPPYPLAWSPYLTFVQPELERVLRKSAKALATVELRLNTELVGLANIDDMPTLKTKNRSTDAMDTTRARFVVGCDGANSFVRKSLGIALEDLKFDEPWLVVDMLLNDTAADLPEVNVQYCDPQRPHTYVVLPRNMRRWEFKLKPGEDPVEMAREKTVWRLLASELTPSQAKMWRSATYRFHALVAERWSKGNVFLAGDACHMTPPFLAQGMVQGIKDATNLAWKLGAVSRGAKHELLDTYEAERRPLVREVISITKGLGSIIGECDPIRAEARNSKMRSEMASGRGTSVRQDLFPPIGSGPLCLPSYSGSTAAGRPAPQPWIISNNKRTRLDDITGPRFRLLALRGFEIGASHDIAASGLGLEIFFIGNNRENAAHDSTHLLLREEDNVFGGWMGAHGAKAIIVRPDHMVLAGLVTEDELSAALDTLKSFFCVAPPPV